MHTDLVMANFLFPCVAPLDGLAQPFSASPSRDNGGRSSVL